MSPKEMEDRAKQQREPRSQSRSRKRSASQLDAEDDVLYAQEHERRRLVLNPPCEEHDPLANDVSRWYDENSTPLLDRDSDDDPLVNDVARWRDEDLAHCFDTYDDDTDCDQEIRLRGRPRWRERDKLPNPFNRNSCGESLLSSEGSRSRCSQSPQNIDDEQAGAGNPPL